MKRKMPSRNAVDIHEMSNDFRMTATTFVVQCCSMLFNIVQCSMPV